MTDLVTLGFKADTRGLSNAQRELDKTSAAGNRADKELDKFNKTLGVVGTAIAALGVTAAAAKIIAYADSWANLSSQLRQVTKDSADLAQTQQRIVDLAKETRTDLAATASLYSNIARNSEDLKLSQDQLINVTGTMNKLLLIQGTSAASAAGAILQLNQGLASGVLRGDEFNSVAEGAPLILNALSESLGIAKGELRDFAATGGITSQRLVKALQEYEHTANKLAENVSKTFAQNMEIANTNVTQFVGNSETLNSAVGSVGESIADLSNNIESVAYAIGAAGAVLAASATPSLLKYTAATVSAGIANVTAATKVTGMSAALGVQAKQATTATIAARSLGAAWRFMLGPVGLAITAVGAAAVAFNLTSDSMERANKAAETHADRMAKVYKVYQSMSQKQLGETYAKAMKEANRIDTERAEILEKLGVAQKKEAEYNQKMGDARSKATNIYKNQVAQLTAQLAVIDNQSKESTETIGLINKAFEDSLVNGTTWSKVVADNSHLLLGSFVDKLKALEDERQQLALTSDAYELYAYKQKLIADKYSPDMIAELTRQKEAIIATRKAMEQATDDKLSFADLTEDVNNFGGAWARTGNIVVDAFGSMSDAISDYSERISDIGKLQVKLDTERKKSGADNVALDKLQLKLNNERAAAELDNYQALASGAASMFDEKTAAAKAFNAINQVLALAEIAMSYQKISAGTAETAAHVANETTKQSSNALTAISSAFAAPFPVNFAAGAAMIGIMSSLLGGAFSSGGSSYEAPKAGGTGSVLGDSSAQSGSIGNSLDQFSDIQIDQLSELKGIRSALNGLSSGIDQLAKSFVTGLDFSESGYSGSLGKVSGAGNSMLTGLTSIAEKIDPTGIISSIIGGFSSKKQKLIDSGIDFMTQTLGSVFSSDALAAEMYQVIETTKKKFWGLSKKTSTSTKNSDLDNSISQQMADIFGFIGDSVLGAAESLLGKSSNFQTMLNSFVIDIGNVSFKDKTGEEIQKELEAIFSQQADLIAVHLVPSIEQFQKVGEGAFETLQRVAYEQAVFNDALNNIGLSLSDLSSLMQIEVSQAIIELTGGVEKFAELTSSYFENFYSESEQLAMLENSLSNVFESLGLSLVGSKEEFKNLVEGIDLTTAEGQALFAALMEINPALADYIDALDDLANDQLNMQITLLEKQGKSEEALALRRQMELEATDESMHAMLKMIWALDDAARAEEERAREVEKAEQLLNRAKSLQVQLLNEQGKSEEALALQREIELAGLDESLRALMLQIYAQQDLNKENEALIKLREDEKRALEELRATLESNVAFAEQQLEKARQAEIARINLTIDAAQDAYNQTLESINLQREAYNQLLTDLEQSVSNAASALDKSLSSELKKYDDLIAAANNSANEQINAINAVSSARLQALNDERSIVASVANQLGAAAKAVNANEALRAARSGNFELATRISPTENYTDATSARIGAAREAFALAEIGKLADAQLSDLDRTIKATKDSADIQVAATEVAAKSQVAELEKQKLEIEKQVKAALGIDESVLSLDVAMAQYQAAQDELQNAISQNTLDKLQAQEDVALQAFEQAKDDAQAQIDALNSQIDNLLNIDNSVMSVKDAIDLLAQERAALANIEQEFLASQVVAQQETTQAIVDAATTIVGGVTAGVIGAINDFGDMIVIPPITIYPPEPPIDIWPTLPGNEIMSSNKEMVNEIKMLRKDLDNANSQIGANTKATADRLRNIEYSREAQSQEVSTL